MKIKYANQKYPFKSLKNHLHGYKDFICIVKRNIPNIAGDQIVDMFRELSSSGCAAATFANVLAESNDFNSSELGISLDDGSVLDYNRVLVDVYSKFYGVAKIKFYEYERWYFDNLASAARDLLGETSESNEENGRRLLATHKYNLDGVTSDGKIIIKAAVPRISEWTGTISNIADKKFNMPQIATSEELQLECKKRQIEVEITDLSIRRKLSGIDGSKTSWYNYYLNSFNGCNLEAVSEQIVAKDFDGDYDEFIRYINDLVEKKGYKICVSEGPNGICWMKKSKEKIFPWYKVSPRPDVCHSMFFKCFDENGDIVVISWGEEYVISKDFFNQLEFEGIRISDKRLNNTL